MPSCAVYGCRNTSRNTTNVGFFSFPKDNELSKIWVNKCKRVGDNVNVKYARICSLHFEYECFQKTKQHQMLNYSPKNRRKIKSDAVPTLLLFDQPVDQPTEFLQSVADRRESETARKSLVNDLIDERSENTLLLMQQEIDRLTKINTDYRAIIKTVTQENEELQSKNVNLEKDQEKLKDANEELQSKNVNLEKDQEKLKDAINALNTFFTKGQLNMILGNKKKIKWNPEDIAAAISLRNVSPKAYRYLKVKLNYPLPDFSTLRRWAANLNTDEGLLMDVLKMLYDDVSERFGTQYIITRRLNQDILENFFSYLRAMGGNEYPSPYEVKHRIKWYILGKHSEAVFSVNKNTEDTTCDTNLTGISSLNNVTEYRSLLPEEQNLKCSSSTLLSGLIEKTPTERETVDDVEAIDENIISSHGLRYLAGYVAHRYILKYPSLNLGIKTKELASTSADSWICKLSRGHLIEPSNELMVIAQEMEQKFNNLHGEFLDKNPLVIQRIVKQLKCIYKDFPEDILQCLVRSRTHIRIKQFILHLKGMDTSDRSKLCKKMRKITSQ